MFIFKYGKSGKAQLLQTLYLFVAALYIFWLVDLIAIKYMGSISPNLLFVLDSLVYVSVEFLPTLSLLIALAFIMGLDKLPRSYWSLFAIPLVLIVVVWTNPLHHLFYKVYSIDSSQIVFGPMLYFGGFYSAACMVASVGFMLNFAFKSKSTLHFKQTIIFLLGSLVPLLTNVLMLLQVLPQSFAITPISFVATIVCHGYIIYRLHFLDIRPIAMQHVLNLISDGYLVTSEKGLIVNYNMQFKEIFGKEHGIVENRYLEDCLKDENVENKMGIHNLQTSIESCKKSGASIFYEQSVNVYEEGESVKRYYMVEVKPLMISNRISGFICIFKDVTKLKESMQRLQNNQVRMMERERLATLGQMMGGMAHNLKTPIMSISGSSTAIENLVDECVLSLEDKDITKEDYQEIYDEMKKWLSRVRVACTYMSDIISAVKGQATNMNVSNDIDFSVDEMLKRVSLLLRHELLNNGCRLEVENAFACDVFLHGDINNMVQVVNNLVSNAIDALRTKGGGGITIGIGENEENLLITVKDHGTGVPPEVKRRLFKQMITSKGAMGTGLGLYISNVVIRGKFDGEMWVEDNTGGGAVFGISIPKENVKFVPIRSEVVS